MEQSSTLGKGSEDITEGLYTLKGKIFGPAKPLPLRVAIASPSDKAWSCHNASALG